MHSRRRSPFPDDLSALLGRSETFTDTPPPTLVELADLLAATLGHLRLYFLGRHEHQARVERAVTRVAGRAVWREGGLLWDSGEWEELGEQEMALSGMEGALWNEFENLKCGLARLTVTPSAAVREPQP